MKRKFNYILVLKNEKGIRMALKLDASFKNLGGHCRYK